LAFASLSPEIDHRLPYFREAANTSRLNFFSTSPFLHTNSGRVMNNATVQNYESHKLSLTHCGRVTQICVFTLQLCKTDDANLRF